MGSSQSSYATKNETKTFSSKKGWSASSRMRGRKSINNKDYFTGSAPHGLRASVISIPSEQLNALDITSAESVHSDDERPMYDELGDDVLEEETDTDYESDDDDEEDEAWEERLRILDDARQLKRIAEYFLHPEAAVKSTLGSRCYFDRASAPKVENGEEVIERDSILADAAFLKQHAVNFMHPEKSVVTSDASVYGRNYYSRYSAPQFESQEDAMERDQILDDANALNRNAKYFLNPEVPMVKSGVTARNYFSRASAPEYDDLDDVVERTRIQQDCLRLKQAAIDYLHPEHPVITTDATTYGRNYFNRISAPEQESLDDACERASIFRDIKILHESAVHYLHPERPIETSDGAVYGRNYFHRHEAPMQEEFKDLKIGQQILEDANAFHQLAIEYRHPELPVIIYATATGRNYFSRASGPEYESLQDDGTRLQVMEDLKVFKSLAVDYLHPELPVVIYSTSTGRNYFSRPDVVTFDDDDERQRIIADAKALKQTAINFLHPELPVRTSDGTACGRNYFSRFSSPEYENQEEIMERKLVENDVKLLHQSAIDFLHPEVPVSTSIGCERNFFSRYAATEYVTVDDAREREVIMAESRALKTLAEQYMHPELPVYTSDCTACGRNYFTRVSAPVFDIVDDSEEREIILAEARALKKLAVDYMHPELPVNGAIACARNYFDRPSSTMHDQMIHSIPAHEDDEYSDHHHEHIDHFGMLDEEMELYNDLRAELAAFPVQPPNGGSNRIGKYGTVTKADSEGESNLSRSPSSVFLFGMDDSIYD